MSLPAPPTYTVPYGPTEKPLKIKHAESLDLRKCEVFLIALQAPSVACCKLFPYALYLHGFFPFKESNQQGAARGNEYSR